MNEMYTLAKREYAKMGVDTEKALRILSEIPVSVHCWQGDDVVGFDGCYGASGGIRASGNYPGRARNFDELAGDLEFAFSLMPGKKRLNLHASYAVLGRDLGIKDRDEYEPEHFAPWVRLSEDLGVSGIDFNPTMFSHRMVKDGLTLSSPDEKVRKFWIDHAVACIRISEYFAEKTGGYCLMNLWIPDGLKDVPADRLGPRLRLKESLDRILSTDYDREKVKIALESKLFGIGAESYTVGSSEFYLAYAAQNGLCCLLDNGHYHPTEKVSDKIPALLAFYDEIALHVTRGVRWDSDHVVLYDDEIKDIAKEIIRCGAADRVMIGLDFFDASVNRISAWVTGHRALQKALLYALLIDHEKLKKLQDEARFTELMALNETYKTMPLGAVWKEYLIRHGMKEDYITKIKEYEKDMVNNR